MRVNAAQRRLLGAGLALAVVVAALAAPVGYVAAQTATVTPSALVPSVATASATATATATRTPAASAAAAGTATATATATTTRGGSGTSTTTATATATATATTTAAATRAGGSPTMVPSVSATRPALRPRAALSLTVTPSSFVAGDAVTISASGFNAGETINLFFPGQISSFAADANGNLTASNYASNAALPAATYVVDAVGVTSTLNVSSSVTVAADLAITGGSITVPGPITAGDTATATVAGFGAGERVCVSFSSQVCQTLATGGGTFSLHFSHIPTGNYTITAYGVTTKRRATTTLQVNSTSQSLTMSPNPAAPGATVTVTAKGFIGSEAVQFSGGPFSQSNGGSAVTAVNGTATATFTVPCTTVTSLTGLAKGQSSSLSASATLNLSAATAAVSAVSNGNSVAVSGSGWGSGETVTLLGPFSTPSTTVTATTAGAFTANLALPTATPATSTTLSYTIDAYGQASQCDAQTTIALGGSSGSLIVTGGSVAGRTAQITSGSVFAAGESVSISSPFAATFTTTADASGELNTSLVVPAGFPAGSYLITALGATSSTTAAAPLTVNVTSSLTLSATNEGHASTLTATGFSPGAVVTFNMPGLALNATTATADASGTAAASVTLGYGTVAGTYFATASQPTNEIRGGVLTPVALSRGSNSISVSTPNATTIDAGLTQLLVSASNFAPGESLELSGPVCVFVNGDEDCSDSPANGTSPITLAAGATDFVDLIVPIFVPSGTYTIRVVGQTSGLGSSQRVTVNNPPPTLTLNPTTGTIGSVISLSGSGFPGREIVNAFEGMEGPRAGAASSSGTVSTTMTITSCSLTGNYAISLNGVQSRKQAFALLTVTNGSTSVPPECDGFALPATPTPVVVSNQPTAVPIPTLAATVIPTVVTSSGGGSTTTTTTTTTTGGCTDASCSSVTFSTCTSASACSGQPVLLTQATSGSGVLSISGIPSLAAFLASPQEDIAGPPGEPRGRRIRPGAPPPIPPALLSGSAPAKLAAQVPASTGAVIIAGNVGVVVPPGALAAVPGQSATFSIQPQPAASVPVPGGGAQFSPNGTILDISITDANGAPVTTFSAPIPIVVRYNAADVGQSNGHPENLTAAYVIDAGSPEIENPLHFPVGTFVLFPPSNTSLNTTTGTITVLTQAIGSTITVVTNPVAYVQTLTPNAPELSSFDPSTSQTFGAKAQFSYLQVVEPQIGDRLLVLDPDTGNYSYVNATDVGTSGPPPATTSAAIVRGFRSGP